MVNVKFSKSMNLLLDDTLNRSYDNDMTTFVGLWHNDLNGLHAGFYVVASSNVPGSIPAGVRSGVCGTVVSNF